MASESVPTASQSLRFGHHHPTAINTCKTADPLWMDMGGGGGEFSQRAWAPPLDKGPGPLQISTHTHGSSDVAGRPRQPRRSMGSLQSRIHKEGWSETERQK